MSVYPTSRGNAQLWLYLVSVRLRLRRARRSTKPKGSACCCAACGYDILNAFLHLVIKIKSINRKIITCQSSVSCKTVNVCDRRIPVVFLHATPCLEVTGASMIWPSCIFYLCKTSCKHYCLHTFQYCDKTFFMRSYMRSLTGIVYSLPDKA